MNKELKDALCRHGEIRRIFERKGMICFDMYDGSFGYYVCAIKAGVKGYLLAMVVEYDWPSEAESFSYQANVPYQPYVMVNKHYARWYEKHPTYCYKQVFDKARRMAL